MIPAFRPSAAALVFVFLAIPALAAEPWEAAPFASEPKALLAAAEAVSAGESAVVVLLDEASHTFDAAGGSVMTQRLVYRIAHESAIDNWGSINAPWAPWYQERPTLQARVVTKDGTVHELDKNAIIEAPSPEASLDIFSDNRIIRAPLPAVAVGSVVEQLITYKSKESLYDAASSDIFFFGNYFPVHKGRLVVDAPAELTLQFVNQSRIEPKKTVADGRQRVVFEGGPFPPKEDMELDLPFDTAPLPWVGVSTAASWADLAKRYSEIVDKQIGDAKVPGPKLSAANRKEAVAQALAWIQSRVRYAGVEVGESSVIPRAPQTVLANRYGDCKDKATLLVALLRQAGIEAHVALLRAGEDFDVPRDLPGLGMFNHAIVVVGDGADAIWVDPTDEYARAGELPLMDQGRQALVASPKTTSITTTPLSESTVNRLVETRTFTLPEEGKATLHEVTEPTGADESAMRRYWVSSDRKRYRESMEEYVRSYYGAKALAKMEASDPHDLGKPFRIELEVTEASRGQSVDGEAAVAIFPSNLLHNLPRALQSRGDKNDDDDDEKKRRRVRRNDFFFTRPFLREWRYRVVPPAGFVARTLPQNETVKLGTMTLTKEYTAGTDGVVTAVFRFDSGKRRLTAVEVEETKKAIAEQQKMPMVLIGFDQRGMLELSRGNISTALTEFRKLASAHPKEGRHQVEIARALLAGGMGEAAREQVRKAIVLEPAYARAHRMLGLILQHDLLGRPFRKGFDLAGSLAAYRKAKQLDPKDHTIRAELARLLEYGEDGLRFGRGHKLDEAVIEWRSLIEDDQKQFQPDLCLALARSARWNELREAAKALEDPVQRNLWRVVAAAATEGSQAAVREAAAVDQSQRKDVLRTAGGVVLAMRMYGTAADLLEEAMQGAPTAESRQQVEGLRKAKRLEDMPLPKDDPKTIARELAIESLMSEMTPESVARFYAADERNFFDSERQRAQWRQSRLGLLSVAQKQGLPLEFYADVGIGTLQMVQDGDEETGYRIRMRPTQSRAREETVYVIRENGQYRISATNDGPALIGWSVLRFLDAGKNEAARQWLNWAREEMQAGGEDPFAAAPFAKFWPKAKQSATPEEMRLAAAMLMPSKELGDRALAILLPAREKAATDEERIRLDHAIALTYILLDDDRTETLIEVARRLAASAPESGVAFNMLTAALSKLDRNDEVLELAGERLKRMPKDDDALRAMGMAAMHKGDYAASEKHYRQVVDELRPVSGDYNNIAWNALLSGKDLDKALEDARQAMQNGGGSALLHTLASLYAETGKSLEAREALLESMDGAGRDEPAPHDWYVLGRIAENYGATDAALAAYKRVDKPKESIPSSTWVLAERRLKAMGKR